LDAVSVSSTPTSKFDLNEIDSKERYDLWRESISVLFEVDLKADTAYEAFSASLTTCHLSSLLLSTTSSQEQFFNRSERLIATDGLDHCLLQLYTHGSTSGQWGRRHHSTVQTGDIFLLDLSQPITSLATDFTNITLVIPRHILSQHLPHVEIYHGCVLPRDSAFAKLLRTHLMTLQTVAPTLNVVEASTIAEGVAHLAGLYFRQSLPTDDLAPINAAMYETVKHYIAQNLSNPELTPEKIAARFNMSRAYLYRLFNSEKGVAHYIHEQRLRSAFRELQCLNKQQRIGEIAFSLGFNSESHFSRSFQRLFGLTPSDVRRQALEQRQAQQNGQFKIDRRYELWVRKL
jgi:AraC-like DNA-binding protein